MVYELSVLDKSPLKEHGSAEAALANTIKLAQTAEKSGFKRFWVAEHHHSDRFASSAPEVLVAYLLAATKQIRIGSGGVMLQHYSPYKVAEQFNVLAALAPNRVDLGVGKTPGGLPASTKALQAEISEASRFSFDQKAELLSQFLGGNTLNEGDFSGLAATPKVQHKAQGFLLGASVESAQFAAKLGWELSYAGHLNGGDEKLRETLKAYSLATNGKVPLVALSAVIASSEKKAKERAKSIVTYKIHFSDRRSYSLPSHESAEEFAKQLGRKDYQIEKHAVQVIAGTAASVSRDLRALSQKYGIQEFMLEFPKTSIEERIAAIESLGAYLHEKEYLIA